MTGHRAIWNADPLAVGGLRGDQNFMPERDWRALAALIVPATATMAISSITPTTSTGHSAPAKTASSCGLRRSDNLLAATKLPIVVTTHPHKYTFNNILITP
jgi:hypothetical protein